MLDRGCSQVMCICVCLLEVCGSRREAIEKHLLEKRLIGRSCLEPTILQITSTVVRVVLVTLPWVQTLQFLLDNDILPCIHLKLNFLLECLETVIWLCSIHVRPLPQRAASNQ